MIQKVLKVGSSAAVVIPKKSLKGLGISIGDDVEVRMYPEARRVSIEAITVPDKRADHITKLGLDFIERYRSDLERLAKE